MTNNIVGIQLADAISSLRNRKPIDLIEIVYGDMVKYRDEDKAAAYAILHTGEIFLTEIENGVYAVDLRHVGSLLDIINKTDDYSKGIISNDISVSLTDDLADYLDCEKMSVDLSSLFAGDRKRRWINRRTGNMIENHIGFILDKFERERTGYDQ